MSYIIIYFKGTTPTYKAAYQFNDNGGPGDRNSMYLPTISAWPLSFLAVP